MMTNETKAPTREEREELLQKYHNRFAGDDPGGWDLQLTECGYALPGLIDAIDALERRNQELLKFADCWAKAETALSDLQISKDAEIRELEKRLTKAEDDEERMFNSWECSQKRSVELEQRLEAAEARNKAWIAKAESWAAIGTRSEQSILLALVSAMEARKEGK